MTTSLGDVAMRDTDGQPVLLRQAWADGPAVLVFLRHFG